MITHFDLENVKLRLEKLYEDSSLIQKDSGNEQDKIFNEGYLKGIEDTLDTLSSFIKQKKQSADALSEHIVPGAQEKHSPKLFELSPEEIFKIDFQKVSKNSYTREELIETAFNIENQLLQIFGDVNSMSFDSYTALSSNQLIDIIKNAAGEICRLNRNQ